MISSAMLSSKKHDWATPQNLFKELNDEFKFNLDVCASAENAKCERYFSEKEDGLKQVWAGRCWMNPPYGRAISHWVKKAHDSVSWGDDYRSDAEFVVRLVPSRTDTAWWQDHVMMASDVVFLRGRLRFVGAPHSAPFPSSIVIFRSGPRQQRPTFSVMYPPRI